MKPPADLFDDLTRRIKNLASKMDLILFAQPMKAEERASLTEDLITLNCFFLAAYRRPNPLLDQAIRDLADTNRKPKPRDRGSWFTPPFIAEYIVKSAVGPLIKKIRSDRKIKDKIGAVLSKRICDPCVGGGIFLVCAHDYLMTEILKIDPKADLSKLSAEVATKCLFGVDINPDAVEGCKLALQLNIAKWGLRDKIEEFARTATPSSSSLSAKCASAVKSGPPSALGRVPGVTSTQRATETSERIRTARRAGNRSESRSGTARSGSAPQGVRRTAASPGRKITSKSSGRKSHA